MKKVINILLPFFATIFLWRLTSNFFNPGGILVMIPVFYYSVFLGRTEFIPMAILGCFLLDINFNTTLLWTILFCVFYGVINLQNIINPYMQKMRGIYLFMCFIGAGVIMISIWDMFQTSSFIPLLWGAWVFIITAALYLPITYLFQRVICWTKK
ncbi:MAG: hypothetical protein LBL75_03190 [Rickettsiales bacterium]|jgi:hypothetical protein|nr:hypothetical protein [Rickettsiales bacterium]